MSPEQIRVSSVNESNLTIKHFLFKFQTIRLSVMSTVYVVVMIKSPTRESDTEKKNELIYFHKRCLFSSCFSSSSFFVFLKYHISKNKHIKYLYISFTNTIIFIILVIIGQKFSYYDTYPEVELRP